MEFETLFQYTGMMLLEEMASIFLTPYLLVFVVPKRVDDILQFIVDFTVDVEGVGHVCSFSVFDFQNHGNSKYGSPFNSSRFHRSSQGKMEKSFLSFQSDYPSWEPNAQGKLFLSTLVKFREQTLQVQENRPAYLASRIQQWTPTFRGMSDRNSYLVRESPLNNVGTGYQLGSFRLNSEQTNYPYILDWYYASHPPDATDEAREIPSQPLDVVKEHTRNFWASSQVTPNEGTFDQSWRHMFDDQSKNHLEASTSAPLFQGSVLQHHDANNAAHPTTSHWWARRAPQHEDPGTSFLEPPNFIREAGAGHYYYDNSSDRSGEEQESLDWRNSNRLARTFIMDDLGGDLDLPFHDINRRASESPCENLDPSDIV